MIKIVIQSVVMAVVLFAAPSTYAYTDSYLMDVGYAEMLNCSGNNGVWRSDELYQNQSVDPYTYGYHETWSMPVAQQVSSAHVQAYTPVYSEYAQDTYSVAAQNLAAVAAQEPAYVRTNAAAYTSPIYAVQPTRTFASQQQYTTTRTVHSAIPSCRLTPSYADNDTIVLSWTTANASTVFIDNGIGHVGAFSGSRAVTPTGSSTYTMTVVSDTGASAQCIAKIVMENSTVSRSPAVTDAATTAGSTITSNTVDSSIDAAVAKTSTVSSNIFAKILGGVETGQTVWDRIRSVSLIAIALILILGVIVFIMKRVFGGGGEGGH